MATNQKEYNYQTSLRTIIDRLLFYQRVSLEYNEMKTRDSNKILMNKQFLIRDIKISLGNKDFIRDKQDISLIRTLNFVTKGYIINYA